ncbi:MAG: YkgJ family cysteine cluster protein [Vampirovibrionales bacterium]|nr:YkgJ family cysteine cluster protein [Vampirovibrionales bacterium]
MLQYELSYIKQHYRALFEEAQAEIEAAFTGLRDEFHCPECQSKGIAPQTPLEVLPHPGCPYQHWQKACLDYLEGAYGRNLLSNIGEMNRARDAVSCHQCGVCCRFASSEFSYEQLQEKAQQGDAFARQFTSVFLPYTDTHAARLRFPELVDDILKEVRLQQAGAKDENNPADTSPVYFYHCPYIGEDNQCTIYGSPKRPDICQSYPDTPLTFIYQRCAWKPWKDEYHQQAMKTHGAIELALYYAAGLKKVLA